MKKLLFMGALLVAGATSYGAVSADFSGGSDSSGTTTGASANASLRLNSRGTVVSTTDNPVLMVTPTVNAGADGESLGFDFGSLVKDESETLEGKFTAEVWFKDKKIKFGDAEIAIALSTADGIDSSDAGTANSSNNAINGIKLKDTSSGEDLGTLSYSITGTNTNNFTYTGTVNATVKASKAGSFNDKTAVVTVSVSNFSYSTAGA